MGCIGSKDGEINKGDDIADRGIQGDKCRTEKPIKAFSKPVWKSDEVMTIDEIKVRGILYAKLDAFSALTPVTYQISLACRARERFSGTHNHIMEEVEVFIDDYDFEIKYLVTHGGCEERKQEDTCCSFCDFRAQMEQNIAIVLYAQFVQQRSGMH
jgi:hypothetical protein